MEPIEVGTAAPDFTLDDVYGKKVNLSDFKGKKILLSWHPLAWTGVCTDQMRSLEVNYDKFEALNTAALGMSVDSSACKKAWTAVLSIQKTPILCDFWPHGKTAGDYGIFMENHGMSKRANIIIDEEGIVRWVKVYPISMLPDINEVLEVLSQL